MAIIGLRKKSTIKFLEFWIWKMLSALLPKILSMLPCVWMHGFTIFLCAYLYNKNILKYAQILVTSDRCMIFHIEGHSKILALKV